MTHHHDAPDPASPLLETTRELDDLQPGDALGVPWLRLVARLPGGGWQESEVFLAVRLDVPNTPYVVVKILGAEAPDHIRRRFEREIMNAKRVSSDSVARVLEVGFDDGRPYMVQEFAYGTPLSEQLRRSPDGRLAPDDGQRLAVGLLEAISDVHAAGVVHRDVKPSNVVIGERPVLVDFGISRFAEDRTLTLPQHRIGTPLYMSPEQLRGEKAGPASDVFSWGVTVALATSGRHPFDPDRSLSTDEYFAAVLHRPPDLAGVPERLQAAVLMALTVPAARRPSADDLLKILIEDRTLLRTAHAVIPLPPYKVADWLSVRGAREARQRAYAAVERYLGSGRIGFLVAIVLVVVLGMVTADLIRLVLLG